MELREQSQAEETTAQDLTLNEEAMEAPEQIEENVEVEITGETVPDLGKAMTKDDIIAGGQDRGEKDKGTNRASRWEAGVMDAMG